MIVAAGKTKDDTPLMVIGFTAEALEQLMAQPMRLAADRAEALGLPSMEVLVCYGRDKDELLDQLGQRARPS